MSNKYQYPMDLTFDIGHLAFDISLIILTYWHPALKVLLLKNVELF